MASRRRPGCLTVLFHFALTMATGGLWLIWLLIRFLLSER